VPSAKVQVNGEELRCSEKPWGKGARREAIELWERLFGKKEGTSRHPPERDELSVFGSKVARQNSGDFPLKGGNPRDVMR